ncbi:hypothetical protein M432DRAFT_161909, partial [Thermoascus aurantiacus ATCC 26904]
LIVSSVPHSPRLLVRPWAPSLLYFSFSSFLFLPRVLLHPRFFRGCLSDSLPLLPLPSPSCRSLSSPEKDGVGLRIILYSSCPFASRELFVIFQLLLSIFVSGLCAAAVDLRPFACEEKIQLFALSHYSILPGKCDTQKIPSPAPPIQIFFSSSVPPSLCSSPLVSAPAGERAIARIHQRQPTPLLTPTMHDSYFLPPCQIYTRSHTSFGNTRAFISIYGDTGGSSATCYIGSAVALTSCRKHVGVDDRSAETWTPWSTLSSGMLDTSGGRADRGWDTVGGSNRSGVRQDGEESTEAEAYVDECRLWHQLRTTRDTCARLQFAA